jgi:outer membrane protein, heavy metal efflux system
MRVNLLSRGQGSVPAMALTFLVMTSPLSIGAAQVSPSDSLDLGEIQALARLNNPTLRGARESVRIPEAQQAQAYRFSNPIMSLGLFPGLNAGMGLNFSVAKAFEVAGQRGLRIDTWTARVDAARWVSADVERGLREKVALAFYRVRVGQELEERVDSVVAVTSRLVDAAQLKYRAGLAPELDVNIARILLLQTRLQRAEVTRELTARTAELNALVGRPSDAALRARGALVQSIPAELSPALLEAYARRVRPDAKALASENKAVSSSIRLARRSAVPDLVFGLGLNRDADGIRTVGLTAGFSLPVFDRNQLNLDRAQANLAIATARAEATDLAISREVRSTLADLTAARAALTAYRDEILTLANSNQRFAATAYARGELDITRATLAQQQYADAQVGYLNAVLAFDEAVVRLEAVLGASLDGLALDETNSGDR